MFTTSEKGRPVIIVGGGLAGLTTALALHRAGVRCFVFEQQEELTAVEPSAAVSLWSNASAILDRLGAGTKARMHGMPTLELQIYDVKNRTLLKKWNLLKEHLSYNGTEIVPVPRDILRQILSELLPPDTVFFGAKFQSYLDRGSYVQVRFDKYGEFEGSFLIGCDGVFSKVRKTMGINLEPKYAGYTTWRSIVNFSDTKHFPFFTGKELWGAGSRFGTLVVNPDRIYWYAIANAAPGQIFLRPFRPQLLQRFQGWPFLCEDLIRNSNEFDIRRYDVYNWPTLGNWTRGRATLVGDAAHPVTPNMHQGTCMSIEDAAYLAQMVSKYGLEDNRALEVYSAVRSRHAQSIVLASRVVGQWGSWQHPAALGARNLLLTYPFIYWIWHKLLKRSNVDFKFPFTLPFTSL
ncbi:Zeaxanthin epoxidase, chloroplastic [Galdieria sulphuraria]|uniref:FAD-dependent monooxygenase/oxidoreductase acting on aromatic compound isoform 1 n=1 Tax=Galdieria sulphuraria TaxID=130081 RepID=M2VUL1_GALSU|nr:FAD-dependent monooxygenase/oxidoreductase acting on aromatic compound isoform 2 [Galdieria sulphuraria]XP_005703376.1 FAD-dependent monooxygenase/oxidoreductase acting on aromatic compound isoform 1 [Galdieria sulphuraria]EME26855.1 FAD-dependent monooxygenase/oxidoreductase acting on aromatic compound isoform 2 [Galdieria sulphuraria]EME26856.1 FAD-dependent monooxygenase/oxidoreductase acting on aromatic compound isoform 1 [Galdieria sulphuraria]GJD12587.1 Zeaxanthin epoxidase, chloroplas|eukprot:XP_005703375.1 FAD-dependent monooxygenase/oxidoreductase acting on aromatic compound isoform 2 [Galdieria sulphuraria]